MGFVLGRTPTIYTCRLRDFVDSPAMFPSQLAKLQRLNLGAFALDILEMGR